MTHEIRCVSCQRVLDSQQAPGGTESQARSPVTHAICDACISMLTQKMRRLECQARAAAQLTSAPI